MSKIKVLGIIGSPRRNGNTELMVDEVLAGAKEAGAEIDKVILNELNISPCQACNSCSKTGICKIQDDMNIVNEKMKESSVFVYGTPVFYWGPTAQFKAFMDRLLATSRQGIIKDKQVIVTIPLGGSESVARHTIGMITDSVNYQKAKIIAQIIAPATGDLGVVKQKTEIMKQAREAGKNVIEKLNK
ncbi:MAG: flavodoxin family protein [Candidatus Heimdallarchaeota archaeon]